LESDDEPEFTEEAAIVKKFDQLHKIFRENPNLRERAVRYQPIGLKELEHLAADNDCTVNATLLINFCDKYCISFYQEDKIAVKGNLKAKMPRRK
jgi:hypothetical protein